MNLRDRITSFFAKTEFETGISLLQECEASLPPHIRLECWGNLYFYKRELQKAIKAYESAINLEPQYVVARYQYLLGGRAEKAGNLVEAFERYRSAIDADPSFVDPYVELGAVCAQQRDWKRALECYERALRLDPTDGRNHHNVVAVLQILARKERGGPTNSDSPISDVLL